MIRFKFKQGSLGRGNRTGLGSQDSFLTLSDVREFSHGDLIWKILRPNKTVVLWTRSFFSDSWFLGKYVCWRFHGFGPYRDQGLLQSSHKLKSIRRLIVTIDGSFTFATLRKLSRLNEVCLVFNEVDLAERQSCEIGNKYVTISRAQKIRQDLPLYVELQKTKDLVILSNKPIPGLDIVTDQNRKKGLLNSNDFFVSINRYGTFSNSVIEALNHGCYIHYVLTNKQAYNFGPLLRFGAVFSIEKNKLFYGMPINKTMNTKLKITWHQIHSKEMQYLLNQF